MNLIRDLIIGLAAFSLFVLAVVALLCRTQLRELIAELRSRGEESCCEDCDDWVDIADVVSDDHAASLRAVDDHFAEDYADVEIPLKGFTPLEEETFHRNYAPMTDPERESLDTAFRKIDRRAGLTVMVRQVLAEYQTQAGADQ